VKRYSEKIVLCMHDGWVARERLDSAELEVLIEETTGFRLRVEEQLLPKYPPIMGQKNPWSFGGSPITEPDGLVVSLSPQWSVPSFVHGRRTRSDTTAKRMSNRPK
jgi:hypothetical protein